MVVGSIPLFSVIFSLLQQQRVSFFGGCQQIACSIRRSMGFSEIWTLYDNKIFDEKERAALERFLAVTVVDYMLFLTVIMSWILLCIIEMKE